MSAEADGTTVALGRHLKHLESHAMGARAAGGEPVRWTWKADGAPPWVRHRATSVRYGVDAARRGCGRGHGAARRGNGSSTGAAEARWWDSAAGSLRLSEPREAARPGSRRRSGR